MLRIETVPILKDNYCFILTDDGGECAVIDPGESGPILRRLKASGKELRKILITHHHFDHTDGVAGLTAEFAAEVFGPAAEKESLPPLDTPLGGGDGFKVGDSECRVIDVAGHTKGHVSFYFPSAAALFSGDSLFSLGCGRLFEGDAETAWRGMELIKELPRETDLHFAHEYTMDNARFATGLEPNNAELREYVESLRKTLENGKFTSPVKLDDEFKHNPFLRGDDPKLAEAVGMKGRAAYKVFAEVRKRKDFF